MAVAVAVASTLGCSAGTRTSRSSSASPRSTLQAHPVKASRFTAKTAIRRAARRMPFMATRMTSSREVAWRSASSTGPASGARTRLGAWTSSGPSSSGRAPRRCPGPWGRTAEGYGMSASAGRAGRRGPAGGLGAVGAVGALGH